EGARLLPLLESEPSQTCAEESARILGRQLPTFEEAIREALGDQDQLTRTLLVGTLDPQLLRGIESEHPLASGRGLQHHRPARREENIVKRVEIILHLRALDIFSRLTTRELSDLAAVVRQETYAAGAAIVREGEFGDCMYIVVEGRIRLTREGTLVALFKPGEFLGERAV